MYIKYQDVVKETGGVFENYGYTIELLTKFIDFCLTPGEHRLAPDTTRGQITKYLSDGKLLRMQMLNYEYDEGKGIFVGDGFWEDKKIVTLKELEYRYSKIKIAITNKSYYSKIGIYLCRIHEDTLEYLVDTYDGGYTTTNISLDILKEVGNCLKKRDYVEITDSLEMQLRGLSTNNYVKVMSSPTGLLAYNFNYTQEVP